MKATATFACVCSLLLAGCHSDLPPPIAPSHQFGANTVHPTKMVYIHRQGDDCSRYYQNGMVELNFIVEPDSSVSHIKVANETPQGCGFAGDVIYAFRGWKFAPTMENGVAVAHESHYTVLFTVI